MQKLKKGTRVRHSDRPAWGVGQLLEDENSGLVKLFFECSGVREMASEFRSKLVVVSGEEAKSMLLDNMSLPTGKNSRPMVTFPQARERFLESFPSGFRDPRLMKEETDYKMVIHRDAMQLLNEEVLSSLLAQHDHASVCERARKFINHSELNPVSPFEKIGFNNGLAALVDKQAFASPFHDWLHGKGPLQARFDRFAAALDAIGAAKWPVLTSFRFFLVPETGILIKPLNLQHAAELSRFEINYKPELNWLTYESAQRFYRHLSEKLADLKPRDMIDIQNFIWCIDPRNGGA